MLIYIMHFITFNPIHVVGFVAGIDRGEVGFLRVEPTAALTLRSWEGGGRESVSIGAPHLRGLWCPPTQGCAVARGGGVV